MTQWPRADCGLVHLGYVASGAMFGVKFDVLTPLDGLPMLVHQGAPVVLMMAAATQARDERS